jgi:transcriptional regulator with XRE-family HTH domain
MDQVRIGEKLVSLTRIRLVVEQAMALRAEGLSQMEVSARLGVDRTLISRLERVGEIRVGHRVALIGFPVANKAAVEELAARLGVDFVWLMTDRERRAFAESLSGAALIDNILGMAARVREFDAVVLLASDRRIRLMESLLDRSHVVPIILGETPLDRDVVVDVGALEEVLMRLRATGVRPESDT